MTRCTNRHNSASLTSDRPGSLTFYQVRLTVPRIGGWRGWDEFERRLAEQEGAATHAQIERWTRRGRDHLQVVIAFTVDAADVAGALDLAWELLMKAAGEDGGWDLAAATAEVRSS